MTNKEKDKIRREYAISLNFKNDTFTETEDILNAVEMIGWEPPNGEEKFNPENPMHYLDFILSWQAFVRSMYADKMIKYNEAEF